VFSYEFFIGYRIYEIEYQVRLFVKKGGRRLWERPPAAIFRYDSTIASLACPAKPGIRKKYNLRISPPHFVGTGFSIKILNIEHPTSNFEWEKRKKQPCEIEERLLKYSVRIIKNDILEKTEE
jgi:hypothetical protein